MKSLALVAAALLSMTPALVGCAEDDYDREPAYPQTIGYSVPPAQPAQVAPPPAPAAPPAQDDEDEDGAAVAPPAAGDDDYADTDPSALSDFRSTLDPYGTWRDDPTYGTVWEPSASVVGDDFVPYETAGHWVYDDDYTWVSDYSWGWAPFHYGRWVYAPGYGWEWVPGREYAGAWVSWRYGWDDWDYVGWAPLGPTWGWFGGYPVGYGFVVSEPYAFCGAGDLFAPNLGARVVTGGAVATVAAHTRPWVAATPSVNGRVAAVPRVNGPPPQVLHIPASSIAHGVVNQRGIAQARAFARPSTAMTLGARAPAAVASAPHFGGRAPAYGSPYASHFGGKLGYGFHGSALNQRPTYAPSTSGLYWNHGAPGPAYSGGRSFGSGYSGYGGGSRTFYGSPYTGGSRGYSGYSHGYSGFNYSHGFSPGGVRPQASHSSGGHSSGGSPSEGGYFPGHVRGGGGWHGGGGGFGGFHGGGGGGGGHGGGGRR